MKGCRFKSLTTKYFLLGMLCGMIIFTVINIVLLWR